MSSPVLGDIYHISAVMAIFLFPSKHFIILAILPFYQTKGHLSIFYPNTSSSLSPPLSFPSSFIYQFRKQNNPNSQNEKGDGSHRSCKSRWKVTTKNPCYCFEGDECGNFILCRHLQKQRGTEERHKTLHLDSIPGEQREQEAPQWPDTNTQPLQLSPPAPLSVSPT